MSKENRLNGIMLRLGDLPPDTIISESRLAEMAGKHTETIRRWRRNNELPESMRLGNERIWTVRCLLQFFNERLAGLQRRNRVEQKRLAAV